MNEQGLAGRQWLGNNVGMREEMCFWTWSHCLLTRNPSPSSSMGLKQVELGVVLHCGQLRALGEILFCREWGHPGPTVGRKEPGHNCWLPGRWPALEVLELEAGEAVWDNTAAPGRWQPAEKHADAPNLHQHLPTARRASTRTPAAAGGAH
ncbi:hypothetical protein SRHO_G00304420 [Serrasalmus rhombeus]